jgi:hypothetical protein
VKIFIHSWPASAGRAEAKMKTEMTEMMSFCDRFMT